MLVFCPPGARTIMKRTKPEIIELDANKLEELLQRAEGALDEEDYKTIRAVIESYLYISDLVDDKNTSIHRLRKLLFGDRTEKTASVIGSQDDVSSEEGCTETAESTHDESDPNHSDSSTSSPSKTEFIPFRTTTTTRFIRVVNVVTASAMIESLADNMTDPAGTLRYEASILRLQFEELKNAFPDGPWAEMVLESVNETVPEADGEALREMAISACVKRGVPKQIFHDPKAFEKHVEKLSQLHVRYTEASATCMTLPPIPRVEHGHSSSMNRTPSSWAN